MFGIVKKLIQTTVVATATVLGVPAGAAHAGLASVGAVHDYVNKVWGVDIPRTHAASNLLNMKYLMQLVDAANEELNGFPTSNFANNDKYATTQIAADITATTAVDTLIKPKCQPDLTDSFCFIPASTSKTYSFQISAAGDYTIDWGDGKSDRIEKTNTSLTTYSHTYANAASRHRILLTGQATAYNTSVSVAAISFKESSAKLSSMTGCLGCIFSTIDDTTVPTNQRQPTFYQSFLGNSGISGKIPENLFAGIYGEPVSSMFYHTFNGYSGLTGEIPENLFAGLQGKPVILLFESTFNGCSGLTGTIPEKLFSGIQGTPAAYMFRDTFSGCTALTSIHENLFSGLKGAPIEALFYGTFRSCRGLTSIPKKLFANITPTGNYRNYMFINTFSGCTNLTGPSAKIGDKYLYEIWPNVSGQNTYNSATKLSDYDCIPTGWGGGGTKQPGQCEPAVDTSAVTGDDGD